MLKKFFLSLPMAAILVASCDSKLQNTQPNGSLVIHFPQNASMPKVPMISTLSEEQRKGATAAESSIEVQLDTNNFILSVTNSAGVSLYYGPFGAAPSTIITQAGTYSVSAKSCDFFTPLFSCPQFGDSKVAIVSPGKECRVLLECDQMNCGIKLSIDSDFLSEYPKGVLFLKSSEGKLMYSYSEKRTAYFRPGAISLVLNNEGKETTLATYNLEAKQMLNLKIDVAASTPTISSGVHIKIDTVRNWISDSILIGNENGSSGGAGADKSTAISVNQARKLGSRTDVWVYGFIVGGDLTSSKCSFELPFTSKTNFVIAEKSSCTEKDMCLSVQLPTGRIRDALNLVDNPGLLGKKIYIKGDLVEAYYGIPGIQSISEYSF